MYTSKGLNIWYLKARYLLFSPRKLIVSLQSLLFQDFKSLESQHSIRFQWSFLLNSTNSRMEKSIIIVVELNYYHSINFKLRVLIFYRNIFCHCSYTSFLHSIQNKLHNHFIAYIIVYVNYSWTLIPTENEGRQLCFCCSWPYSHIIEKQKDMYYFLFPYNLEKKKSEHSNNYTCVIQTHWKMCLRWNCYWFEELGMLLKTNTRKTFEKYGWQNRNMYVWLNRDTSLSLLFSSKAVFQTGC